MSKGLAQNQRAAYLSMRPHEHHPLGGGAGCWSFSSCVRQAQDEGPAREQPESLLEPSRHRESTVADRTPRGELVRPSTYTFGRRLRDQRERHGVTLETIAANTKISASLLAGLERGDVSAWPSGIFR